MAPIQLKYVVSFSSQDEVHKVNNLICSDGTKKWLTHSKDRSGQAEAVFQLESPSVISYIDIGSIWSAMVEIQVGCSDWPQDKPYQTLVPTCSLMTPADCRLGQNFIKTRMFGANDFSEENAFKEWDRLKIILRQPFKREAQYGLSFLNLKSTIKTPSSVSKTQSGKSVKAIQTHFFGKSANSSSKEDQLKTKLLKIAGSSENGSEHKESLTRTAKLVLAGSTSGNKMTGKKQEVECPKPSLYSSHMAQKYGPQFDEEVQEFLKTLTLVEEELDRITMADLRHRFERKKKRKLTLEEKKTFVKLARDHLNSIFGEEGGEEISSQSKHINLKTDQNSEKQVLQDNDEKSSNKTERDMTSVREKTNAKQENNVPGKSPLSFKKSTPLAQVKHGEHRANSPGSSPKPFMKKLVRNLGFSPTVKKPSAKPTENFEKGEKNSVKTLQKIGSKEVFSTSYEVLGCDDRNNEVEIQNTDNLWLNCNSSPVTPKSVGRGRGGRGRGRRRGSQTKEGGNSERKRGKPLSGVNDLEEDTVVKKRKVSGRGRRGRGRGASACNSSPCGTHCTNGQTNNMSCLQTSDTTSPSSPNEEWTPTTRKFCPECSEWIPENVYTDHSAGCKYKPRSNSWQNSGGFLPNISSVYQHNGGNIPATTQRSAISNSSQSRSNFIDVETYEYELETVDSYVECPICSNMFSSNTIEVHAAICCEMSMVY